MKVSDFEYELPQEAIAQAAIEPRHSARLLDTRDMSDHRFIELPDLLEPGDLLVVNETKVRAARLVGTREGTGGRIEVLLLDRQPDGSWQALARPARRLRPGVVLQFEGLTGMVESLPTEGMVSIRLQAREEEAAVEEVGHLPLPPYFKGKLADPSRYQTMFANKPGSAAAPTAGLHFTHEVVEALDERGIGLSSVDLHVSIDTFRPISTPEVEDHRMHSEWCAVPAATAESVSQTRKSGGKVVAVGTTVVRTLESFADGDGGVGSGEMSTDLFITPGFEFGVVDALVTNFHMPGSSLLVLLAAFMGEEWRSVYRTALDRGYRFLSFGDAMYAELRQT